jgi:RNA polymerase sigma-70 factor (ECF subfamily)
MKLTRDAQLELVSQALAGDASAFGKLYEEFTPHVRRTIYRMCLPDDLEDMVQGIFLHVYERLDQFKGDSEFSTWLYRVAYNYTLGQMRARRTRGERVTTSLDETYESEDGDLVQKYEPVYVDDALEARLEYRELYEAIDKLKPREGLFIRMQMQGMDLVEIAEATGDTVQMVKSELHRGKRKLASILGVGRKVAPTKRNYKNAEVQPKLEQEAVLTTS